MEQTVDECNTWMNIKIILQSKRNQAPPKRLHSVRFHLHTILGNAYLSLVIENRSVATWEWEKGEWEGLKNDRKFLEMTDIYFLDCGDGFNVHPLVIHQTVHFKFVQFAVGRRYLNKFSLKKVKLIK